MCGSTTKEEGNYLYIFPLKPLPYNHNSRVYISFLTKSIIDYTCITCTALPGLLYTGQ